MRKFIVAALLLFTAGAANAQSPPQLPNPPLPAPRPGPTLACTDLAIAGWNGSRSPPGAPLAANEVAIYFHVRNNGPRTYTAPDENKQWISLVLDMPTGPQVIGVNVAAAIGFGPGFSYTRRKLAWTRPRHASSGRHTHEPPAGAAPA